MIFEFLGVNMLLRKKLANAIRILSVDAIQKAKSGHPGMPMGMADIAEVLWNDFLKHNPADPKWANRDRFVLSNGHGSMLIYALLHLTGYDVSMEDIKQFRQLHSKTAGHPEYGITPGIETTTGPLGQGIANAVGMAIAERTLAAQFNRPNHRIIDHYTYVFLGDGCMMEGISHEVCSLAGTLKLGKLIAFYDDNGISIDGEVEGWFTDKTAKRFKAYGWQVIDNVDGHNPKSIKKAIKKARRIKDRPSLICCKTKIGWGSPNKAGKESCHGSPLGDEEIALVRERLKWFDLPFEIPDEIYTFWNAREKGETAQNQWNQKVSAYETDYPELATELERRLANKLPEDFLEQAHTFVNKVDIKQETIASRKASQNALNGLAPSLPELIGGSADLAGSNLTLWAGSQSIHEIANGNYIFYGVREFGMVAMMNGIALHGGFIPYGATFLVFSDYARNAIRMAALMKIRAIFVLTHDSIGLGEDGPTHQPVEQIASLRLIPNLSVWRPCDAVESAVAWKSAIQRQSAPSCLIFSRQSLPHQLREAEQLEAIERGGYILLDCEGTPEAILIATGSEVSLAIDAAHQLTEAGKKIRVVSMPSVDVFESQDANYIESVLPVQVTARLAVEAGVTDIWFKYVGSQGKVLGIDSFGESAPAKSLFEHFGLTVDKVINTIESML